MKLTNLNGKNRVLKKIKDYLYLILLITIVSVFVLFLAPCIDDVPYVKPLIKFIDDREIDAGAIYYTDIEEFSVAEINMKNTMEYLPHLTPDLKRIKEKILIDD